MDPVTVTAREPAAAVPLHVWPSATVTGRLKDLPPGKIPTALKLVVEAPPWRDFDKQPIPRGTEFRCAVSREGAWKCEVPALKLDLAVAAAGYVREYRWNVRLSPGAETDLGAITLREGGSVVAWLQPETQAAGREAGAWAALTRPVPVHASRVVRDLARPVAEARFDANGFVQLAPVPAGTYVLEVGAKAFATDRAFPVEVREGRETALRRGIVLGRPLSATFAVSPPTEPGGRRWRAAVLRGSPIGTAYERDPVFAGEVPASGIIVIPGQSPGRFRVTIADRDANEVAEHEFTISGQHDARHAIDIRIVRIRGTIHREETPLQARLTFGGTRGLPRVRMRSNDAGEFEGWLPRDGSWRVDVHADDGTLATSVNTDVVEGRDVELNVTATRVSGVVTRSERPVDKVHVMLTDEKGLLLSTFSDSSGKFEFTGAAAGAHTLIARSRDGATSKPRPIHLAHAAAALDGLRVELQNPGVIAGVVLGDGRPVVLASVHAFAGGMGSGTVTDQEGRFAIQVPVHADKAMFLVRAPGRVLTVYERQLADRHDPEMVFEVAATGGSLQFDLPGQPTGVSLLQNGIPVPLPLVLEWAQSQGAAVRPNAPVTIANVAAGEYRLCARSGALKQECAQGVLVPGATLSLRLGRD